MGESREKDDSKDRVDASDIGAAGDVTDAHHRYVGIRLDDRAVRVLAHPLRSRLLGQLRVMGPATATELAARLSTNTGATSYHLRALESVGLVTDTGDGVGKRRLWRASSDYHSWTNSDFAGDDDARTALDWLQRDYIRQFAARAERWQDVVDQWPVEWVDAVGLNDTFVTVTPQQALRLRDELDALLARYRTIGEGEPAARRLHVTTHTSPLDPTPPESTPLESTGPAVSEGDPGLSGADAGD
ncbi:helix-turn-helix domain-containing protein [Herbiconiux daphne]|uniref:Helix-turn-helix domain-containing protein n=1 Tax=Herbiconiux daphne TaxID=2970914 RepID=A0ABT2H1A8_9MICO|nr:helix-turn-helix domain-containing protein [Herbiconiux daphne]MCS5733718.1 helix-turn-helix domain-containing protein [Herbiconiux daphne]